MNGIIKHTLPELKFKYSDLEPFIDATTIEIHYTKHHQAYVDGLNKAEEQLTKARKDGDFSLIKHLKKEIAFHGSGHILHSLYWANMTCANKSKVNQNSKIYKEIERCFGSFVNFTKEFKASSLSVEGSGWGILVYINNSLEILTIEKHQNLYRIGAIPLLVCDVWEHAYYLKYQNKRVDYIEGWFKLIDWDDIEARYYKASTKELTTKY